MNYAITSCYYSNSYNNLLAVSLTQYNISGGGLIRYGTNQFAGSTSSASWPVTQPFYVQWNHLPLYIYDSGSGCAAIAPYAACPYGVTHTFTVALYPTGKIEYSYQSITDPELYALYTAPSRTWLVGLRQISGQSISTSNRNQWTDHNTQVVPSNGTYPPINSVTNSSSIIFWPIGTHSCISPLYGASDGSSYVRIVLKTYNNASQNIPFQCQYYQGPTFIGQNNATYDPILNVFQCYPPAFYVGTSVTVSLWDDEMLPLNIMEHSYLSPDDPALASIYSLQTFCNDCQEFLGNFCWYDCVGVLRGSAFVDQCGYCVGGTTGLPPLFALDCQGICSGPFAVLPSGVCRCDNNDGCSALPYQSEYIANGPLYQYAYQLNASYPSSDPVISFSSPLFTPLRYADNTTLTPTSPLYPFALSFSFPYYAQSYRTIYISPHGAIYLSIPSSVCYQHASLLLTTSTLCNISIIAGALTEYDSTIINNTNIIPYSYYSNNNIFIIKYNNLPLLYTNNYTGHYNTSFINEYGLNIHYSFMIAIYPSGRITITYISIQPAFHYSGLPYTRQWLVGVLDGSSDALDLLAVAPSLLEAPLANVAGYFATSIQTQYTHTTSSSIPPSVPSNGVYIPQQLSLSNQSLSFFNFPLNICISPKTSIYSGGSTLRVSFSTSAQVSTIWTAAYMSSLSLHCEFGTNITPAIYNITTNTINCQVPAHNIYSAVPFYLLILVNNTYYIITTNQVYFAYISNISPSVQTDLDINIYCNDCSQYNPTYCTIDCARTWRGNATLDDCLECSGGTTGVTRNSAMDCYGVCYGPYLFNNMTDQCQCNDPYFNTCMTMIPSIQPQPPLSTNYVYQIVRTTANTINALTTMPITVNSSITITSYNNAAFTIAGNLIQVPLSFIFTFFSTPYNSIYITNNGAIYFDVMEQQCIANASFSLFAPLNSTTTILGCEHTLIAVALTNYTDLSHLNVTVISNITSIIIIWSGLSLLTINQNIYNYTFSAILSNDGSIITTYTYYIDPSVNNTAQPLLIGVRTGQSLLYNYVAPFPFFFDYASYPLNPSTQVQQYAYPAVPRSPVSPNEMAYLNTSTVPSGTFPPRITRLVNTLVTYCPVSDHFCLSPTSGPFSGGNIVRVANSGFACTSQHCCYTALNTTCVFGGVSVPAIYNTTANVFQCVAPLGTLNTNVSFWLAVNGNRVGSATPILYRYTATSAATLTDIGLCHRCGPFLPAFCTVDCAGNYFGSGVIDSCGLCTSSRSYYNAVDCMGICFGPFIYVNSSVGVAVPSTAVSNCGCPLSVTIDGDAPTQLCSLYTRADGGESIGSTISVINDYEWLVLAIAFSGVIMIAAIYLIHRASVRLAYIRMSPTERRRFDRRAERRRLREAIRQARFGSENEWTFTWLWQTITASSSSSSTAAAAPPAEAALPAGVAARPLPPPENSVVRQAESAPPHFRTLNERAAEAEEANEESANVSDVSVKLPPNEGAPNGKTGDTHDTASLAADNGSVPVAEPVEDIHVSESNSSISSMVPQTPSQRLDEQLVQHGRGSSVSSLSSMRHSASSPTLENAFVIPPGKWSCPQCTLVQSIKLKKCGLCHFTQQTTNNKK